VLQAAENSLVLQAAASFFFRAAVAGANVSDSIAGQPLWL